MIINRLPYPLNLEEFDTLKEGIDVVKILNMSKNS